MKIAVLRKGRAKLPLIRAAAHAHVICLENFQVNETIKKIVFPIKVIFQTKELLDMLALLLLVIMVAVAVPYGIIHRFIDRDQALPGILFSIFLLISIGLFIYYIRKKQIIFLRIGIFFFCLVTGLGIFLML